MKTPREILLQRHEAMEPRLNAARARALAEMDRPGIMESWREFLASLRWHFAGLSAVWIVILILRVESAPTPAIVMAHGKIPPARALLAALLRNQRELIELTESPVPGVPPLLPPRRSENSPAMEIV